MSSQQQGNDDLLRKLSFAAFASVALATVYWTRKRAASTSRDTQTHRRVKRIHSHALNLHQSINKAVPYYLIGGSMAEIPTPALIIDLDALEGNIEALNQVMKQFPRVNLRPHYKAHKCPQLAFNQMEAHADRFNGICCQKLSEAESLIVHPEFPVNDIFIANEVVEQVKIERIAKLLNLHPEIELSLTVDNADVIKLIASTFKSNALGRRVGLIIEYNVGQNRCGVNSVEELIELAREICAHEKYIYLKGIQCYQGANQQIRSWSERKEAVENVSKMALEARDALVREGFVDDISKFLVTGGGTGTYTFEAESGVFNEVQPGSYVFMDASYNRNLVQNGTTFAESSEFKQSLFVLSTVMSKARDNSRAVLDAGLKAVSLDSGVPLLNDAEFAQDLYYKSGGDEHGILLSNSGSTSLIEKLRVGDKLKLIPGHCDPTVNMYDWFICVRGEQVVDVWQISGRSSGL